MPPFSPPFGVVHLVDHVGAIPLAGDLTAGEELAVKPPPLSLCYCQWAHWLQRDPHVSDLGLGLRLIQIQILMHVCKNHIWRFRALIWVVQILWCSLFSLVFNKNMKYAMFFRKINSFYLSLLFMEKRGNAYLLMYNSKCY
jgi:hypothetical protein